MHLSVNIPRQEDKAKGKARDGGLILGRMLKSASAAAPARGNDPLLEG
jgi:hypothetical protein